MPRQRRRKSPLLVRLVSLPFRMTFGLLGYFWRNAGKGYKFSKINRRWR
jgi:hypothetical protein